PIGLSGSKPIWSMSRPDAEALAQPRMSTALEEIAAVVPANSEIGYVLGRDGWDYPLYGSTLDRHVTPLPHNDSLDAARRLHVPWVVIGNVDTPGLASPAWIGVRFESSGWTLLAPRSTPSATQLLAYARSAQSHAEAAKRARPAGAARGPRLGGPTAARLPSCWRNDRRKPRGGAAATSSLAPAAAPS